MRSSPNANQFRIFSQFLDKPMGSWKRAWTTARRLAGVRIRFHDLRHTTVTRLLDAGCTLEQISPILGWSAATMTAMMKRYQHRSLEKRRETMLALVTGRKSGKGEELKALESLLSSKVLNDSALHDIAQFVMYRIKKLQNPESSEK